MSKLNAFWIVFIVLCSVMCLGSLIYFIYRLFIKYIYKREQLWKDISSSSSVKDHSEHRVSMQSISPRQSLLPLIQEYLPHELRKSIKLRRMATELRFDEPPKLEYNFQQEWDEMDTKSHLNFQYLIEFYLFRFFFQVYFLFDIYQVIHRFIHFECNNPNLIMIDTIQ